MTLRCHPSLTMGQQAMAIMVTWQFESTSFRVSYWPLKRKTINNSRKLIPSSISNPKKGLSPKIMNQWNRINNSLPFDIAVKISSSLQVSDLCSLGSCCKSWRELWGSDPIWEPLCRERWSVKCMLGESSVPELHTPKEGWKSFYIKWHHEMANRATNVVWFVESCSSSESLEVGDHLKAIECLRDMQLGFKDVKVFLFKPNLNVLLNLIGLHYCILWLNVPAEQVMEAIQSCNISERQICVKWWKLGRWFYGFRLRDESHCRRVSLGDLAKEDEVLWVLHRGAIHEVLRVQISIPSPRTTSWSCQSSQT